MKSYLALFVLFLALVNAKDYVVYRKMDWNQDVKHVDFESVEQMKTICDEIEECIGFNTHGWLKKLGGVMNQETAVDLYIISSIHGPSGKEPDNVLWPLPNNFTNGNTIVDVDMKNIKLVTETASDDVVNAFNRLVKRVNVHTANVSDGNINTITVSIEDLNCDLQQGYDESYSLYIPDSATTIEIKSKCIYGYYHALTSLNQLIQWSPADHVYHIKHAPWSIQDHPSFGYRGLLIDSSRHFLPVRAIYNVIDSMSLIKLNVLHWHISDEQSFPMEIEGIDMFPSSYSAYERYTLEDTEEVIEYARQRGIRVMPEIDVPGHAAIWCKSDPSICPSETCLTPLNPASEHTFEVIEAMIKSVSKRLPEALFHVGGDEVNTQCWNDVPEIAAWMKEKGYSTTDAYGYFINRVYDILKKYNRSPVFWEEVYRSFSVPKDSIIEVWLGQQNAVKDVTSKGFRAIYSNYYQWYLDQLYLHWNSYYGLSFLDGITDPEQLKLVLGGEVCMWGEKVDISVQEKTILPRALAASETLWTRAELLNQDTVLDRLIYQRCWLNWNGIPASPTLGDGRSDPIEPNSCFFQ
ncbi:hypothetical protein WA158_000965 [Blastocystis sp. Blastoise]